MDAAVAQQLGSSTREAMVLYQKVKQLSESFDTELVLPEIVVIGNQSAGKSSLLTKLLSGAVTFPSAMGTCTKCPIVVHSRFSEGRQQCSFKLRYRYDDHGKELASIDTKDEEKVLFEEDWGDISKTIEKLQAKLLKKKGFTMNEVVMNVEGPDFPDLDIKDLPGLIKVGESRDISAVKRMVDKSINKDNAIIMVCVPLTDDIDNQEALQIALEADPHGERTLGVLTKPDRVEKGAEEEVLKLLKNEHPKAKLQTAWFVVRCPSPEESKNKKFDSSKANEAEHHFFDNEIIGQQMKRATPNYGSQALLEWISMKISREIHEQVPKLFPEVKKLYKQTSEKLKLACNNITESNARDFILNTTNELATQAAKQIRCEGSASRDHYQKIKGLLIQLRAQLQDTEPKFTKRKDEECWTLAKVEKLLQTTQGRELFPCTDTSSAVNLIIKDSLKLWPGMVKDTVEEVNEETIGFLHKLVDKMETYHQYSTVLKKQIDNVVAEQRMVLEKQAQDIMREHGCTNHDEQRFFTTNDKELQRLYHEKWWHVSTMGQTLLTRLCNFFFQFVVYAMPILVCRLAVSFLLERLETHIMGGQTPVWKETFIFFGVPLSSFAVWSGITNILQRIGMQSSKTTLALQVMAQAMAYWELAVKRFADDIGTAVDDRMLHAFADELSSSLRGSMRVCDQSPQELMNAILSEEDIEKRRNLEKRLEQEKEICDSIRLYMERNCNPLTGLQGNAMRDALDVSSGYADE